MAIFFFKRPSFRDYEMEMSFLSFKNELHIFQSLVINNNHCLSAIEVNQVTFVVQFSYCLSLSFKKLYNLSIFYPPNFIISLLKGLIG